MNFDMKLFVHHEQMDIDEFFNNLLYKIENQLKNTNNENLIFSKEISPFRFSRRLPTQSLKKSFLFYYKFKI